LGAASRRVVVVGVDDHTDASAALLDDLADLRPSGILLLNRNVVDADQVGTFVAELRRVLPPGALVATDEEGGRVSAFRRVVGRQPSPRALAVRTEDELRRHAQTVGEQLRRCGVDWNLAPVVDLDDGPGNGPIGDRAFSADASVTTHCARAFVAGFGDVGLLTCAKHFPGQGRASVDTHLASATVAASMHELAESIAPFRALVAAGVPAVMVGHAVYPAIDATAPASLSPAVYNLLRELGFGGAAVTDSLAMKAISSHCGPGEGAVRAIAAGADAVLTSSLDDGKAMPDAIVAAVREGGLRHERVVAAASRVEALSLNRRPWAPV
jgi:beta-N-acetylhexosaminidase